MLKLSKRKAGGANLILSSTDAPGYERNAMHGENVCNIWHAILDSHNRHQVRSGINPGHTDANPMSRTGACTANGSRDAPGVARSGFRRDILWQTLKDVFTCEFQHFSGLGALKNGMDVVAVYQHEEGVSEPFGITGFDLPLSDSMFD